MPQARPPLPVWLTMVKAITRLGEWTFGRLTTDEIVFVKFVIMDDYVQICDRKLQLGFVTKVIDHNDKVFQEKGKIEIWFFV